MVSFTLAQAVSACNGKYIGDENKLSQSITGVTIDSRSVDNGFLFIPIRGERFDGHDFITAAQDAGALCCLSEKRLTGRSPYILVDSALDAFQMIAAYYRSLFCIPAVAISGSAGKTTTKELITGVLSQKFNVLKNEGNLNNQTGVPLTVLRLEPAHQVAVIEMGMNHFGEILNLSRIVRPDICVLTNIGEAHLEFLGSKEGILKAKSEMFEYMAPQGNIVINGDDPLLTTITSQYPDAITIGIGDNNRIRAKDVQDMGLAGSRFIASYDGKDIPVHVPSPGRHMIMNSLAALAVGILLGVNERDIQAGINDYVPSSGRMHVIEASGFTIISDAYNANPTSMAASISITAKAKGRSVCILGDMFELGQNEAQYHKEIGRHAAKAGIDRIICVGELSKHIYEGAQEKGSDAHYFPDKVSLINALPALIAPKDTILVKASHGMRLDSVVQWLVDNH